MNEITNAQAKEALKAVFKRASIDADFRAKCLNDPKAAVKEVAGWNVPAGFEFKFVEPGSPICITLPPLAGPEEALGEEALGSVAGGGGGCPSEGQYMGTCDDRNNTNTSAKPCIIM